MSGATLLRELEIVQAGGATLLGEPDSVGGGNRLSTRNGLSTRMNNHRVSLKTSNVVGDVVVVQRLSLPDHIGRRGRVIHPARPPGKDDTAGRPQGMSVLVR